MFPLGVAEWASAVWPWFSSTTQRPIRSQESYQTLPISSKRSTYRSTFGCPFLRLECSFEQLISIFRGLIRFHDPLGRSPWTCWLLPQRGTSLDWVSYYTVKPYWTPVEGVEHEDALDPTLLSCHPCIFPMSSLSLLEIICSSSSDILCHHSSTRKAWLCIGTWLTRSWMMSSSCQVRTWVFDYTQSKCTWMIVTYFRLN